MDLQFESTKLSTLWGYVSATALGFATNGTIALMNGFFLKPSATFDVSMADVLPLFDGLISNIGISEIAMRVPAARYGVNLSPSVLIPSTWTGCFGVTNLGVTVTKQESPFRYSCCLNSSAYLTSLALVITAFVSDQRFNGGENA